MRDAFCIGCKLQTYGRYCLPRPNEILARKARKPGGTSSRSDCSRKGTQISSPLLKGCSYENFGQQYSVTQFSIASSEKWNLSKKRALFMYHTWPGLLGMTGCSWKVTQINSPLLEGRSCENFGPYSVVCSSFSNCSFSKVGGSIKTGVYDTILYRIKQIK